MTLSSPVLKKRTTSLKLIERVSKKIPDPVVLFATFFVIALISSWLLADTSFDVDGPAGAANYQIKNMLATENIRWMFDNAILNNWLNFGHGILGTILLVMIGVGIAEHSGLLSAMIRRLGYTIPQQLLAPFLVFLGIMSSIATDAGYLILIPLAGMLYSTQNKNPLIGMAAAFAGVSAGFSANLIPATPVDVFIGVNAQAFAEIQGIPFEDSLGNSLTPATMHYFFIVCSTVLLTVLGGWINRRFTEPRLATDKINHSPVNETDFILTPKEIAGFRAAGITLIVALAGLYFLADGPLATYQNEQGHTVTPYLDNVIILTTFLFAITGIAYGIVVEKFTCAQDVIDAMTKQMNSMGYVLVLSLFSHNFLSVLTYSNLGTYITHLGASSLIAIGLKNSPLLLLFLFIMMTALINLLIGGLSSKWMLLGPLFIPMLYQVHPGMTPDIVSAAYRVADSATNIITPMMSYAGVILMFMRKYKPDMTLGDMIVMMFPYSMAFLISWSALLMFFFLFKIPLGF